MSNIIKTNHFFEDKEFEKLVNLTQEECQFLINQIVNEEYHSGVHGISGGFADITLEEYGEDEEEISEDRNIILGHMKVGVQSDCENNVSTYRIIFDRKKLELKFD